MAALDVATCVENMRQVIANLSWWQGITQTANATDAARKIFKFAADDEQLQQVPLIVLDVEDLPTNKGPSRLEGPLSIMCDLILAIPSANQANVTAQAEYFWAQLSSLLDGFNANVNADGAMMWESLEMIDKPGPIDPNENEGRIEWLTSLRLNIHLE